MIERTIKLMIQAGAAAVHIEDQVADKRCGHRKGKELVSKEEMCERIRAAVEAKTQHEFVVMARTDAFSVEGLEDSLERAIAYEKAGADMLFFEAPDKLEDYRAIKKAVSIPILANMTGIWTNPALYYN